MKVSSFVQLLKENPQSIVAFEYAENQFVPQQYHLTELKNQWYESMDCGGNSHSGKTVVAQLMSRETEAGKHLLTAEKMLKIFDAVHSKLGLAMEEEIEFEYGNEQLRTALFKVKDFVVEADKIHVKMFVEATQCKPATMAAAGNKSVGCC